jgi:putative membrane protein
MSGRPPFGLDDLRAIQRPERKLWTYYVLKSMILGPFFPLLLLPLFLRFRTLRYRFDEEGVAMRWGALFRREVHLAYDRIQDIHLVSNAAERWLGLAQIKIQTASGSAKAEMTLEGVREYEAVRDFLYSRMRGQQESGETANGTGDASERQVLAELRRATAELRSIRELFARKTQDDA